MATLREGLRDAGCAELDLDAYDARWEPDADEDAEIVAVRMEYLVELERNTDRMRQRLAPDHLRSVKRGDAEGWRLTIAGAANTSGGALQISGADGTGCSFSAAAWCGDELLAQTKVGVAGRRATAATARHRGRPDIGALTWLQWTVMWPARQARCERLQPSARRQPPRPRTNSAMTRCGIGWDSHR